MTGGAAGVLDENHPQMDGRFRGCLCPGVGFNHGAANLNFHGCLLRSLPRNLFVTLPVWAKESRLMKKTENFRKYSRDGSLCM